MSVFSFIFYLSIIGLFVYVFSNYRQNRSLWIPLLLILVVALAHLLIGPSNPFLIKDDSGLISKGDKDTERSVGQELIISGLLYISMVLGILAEYFYSRLTSKDQKEKQSYKGVLAAMLASPIVFIPLYASIQGGETEMNSLNSAKLMTFLVAFQNGFFWKVFFDKQKSGVHENQ